MTLFWLMIYELATQFYATLCYLSSYHDHIPATPPSNVPTTIPQLKKIPKNPSPNQQHQSQQHPEDSQQHGSLAAREEPLEPQEPQLPPPDPPHVFAKRQRELARDLILKEQQIEYLVSVLPGIHNTEQEQESRIKALAAELRIVEAKRMAKRKEMKRVQRQVDDLLDVVSTGLGVSEKE